MKPGAPETVESNEIAWYLLEPAEAAARLEVAPDQGLGADEAVARLSRYGPNELVERGGRRPGASSWSSSPARWC